MHLLAECFDQLLDLKLVFCGQWRADLVNDDSCKCEGRVQVRLCLHLSDRFEELDHSPDRVLVIICLRSLELGGGKPFVPGCSCQPSAPAVIASTASRSGVR